MPIFAPDYLALRLSRLKSSEEWTPNGQGLSFLFAKEGAGSYVSGTVVDSLSTGDVLVFSSAETGRVYASDGGELIFWSFSLCLEQMFPLFAANEISRLKQVAESLKGAKLYRASTALAAECHRLISETPPQFNLDQRIQLLRVAAAVVAEEFKTAAVKHAGFVRIADRILQVFDKLSTEDLLALSVGELARRFGCSRRHLNRLFHKYFGFSAIALRMELRLLKAGTLLRDPDAKVINVARQCGFNHLGQFNTCFKRRFGTNPRKWRKATAQPEGTLPGRLDPQSDCPLASVGVCPWIGNSAKSRPTDAGRARNRKAAPSRLLITIKALNPSETTPLPVWTRSFEIGSGRSLSPRALK